MAIPKTPEEEQQQVNEFKKSLESSALEGFPDEVLVQFLQANVWNMDAAKKQLLDTIQWRKKLDVDHVPVATKYNKLPIIVACRGYKNIEDGNFDAKPELSESVIRIINSTGGDCFHKFDKEGHPILIDRTGYHNSKQMGSKVTRDEIINYHIAANEFLNRVIMPEGCERAGKPIHSETVIFDCTNMGLHQFHMNAFYLLKAVADVVQRYYPETLHRLFIVNAPGVFVTMFRVIKAWLNPRTLEKIHVLGSDYKDILLEHIDAESLPDFLGGSCKCEHMGGCVPEIANVSTEMFTVTNDNEKVPTVYNSQIMERAKTDDRLCKLNKV
ncbi:hypothetical protein CU097_009329 [Rhizopus azygosporus]|uniref:CRAL-TRIO domain-containing protein n=1 Tax=Rhizopus azygosporus TaxID=86630 RepID=A0A367K6U9_RHIAZ|nr:hypothetical protein CU097_009329 [Rhizopus azygosporus]